MPVKLTGLRCQRCPPPLAAVTCYVRWIMKRLPIILAVILITGFAVLGISNITERENKVRFQQVELQSTTNKLKLNELKQQKLYKDMQNTLNEKNVTEEKVKQLEETNRQLEIEKQELQKQVLAKKEAQRVAQEKINTAARSVSFTAQASAAPAPAPAPRPAPAPTVAATGSGCEWLRGKLSSMGVSSGDMPAALSIAQRESGCRPGAQNPNGGACNVFQELPCGKWGGLGNTDAHLQGAIAYAKNRYGGWWGAHSFWQANHWW